MSLIRRIATVTVVAVSAVLAVAGAAVAAPTTHSRPSHHSSISGLGGIRCAAPGHPAITVVLVHGAWAQPSSWNGEVARLQKVGCQVHAVGYPVQDLTTDSQSVADYSTSVLDTLPMTTLYTTFSYPGAPVGASDTLLRESVFVKDFASDLPAKEAPNLYAEQTPASTQAFATPSQYAAWQTLPSWAFVSTGDKIITPQAKEFMAHRAHSHITVFPGGSHLSLVSHPAAVTAVIGQALASLLHHS